MNGTLARSSVDPIKNWRLNKTKQNKTKQTSPSQLLGIPASITCLQRQKMKIPSKSPKMGWKRNKENSPNRPSSHPESMLSQTSIYVFRHSPTVHTLLTYLHIRLPLYSTVSRRRKPRKGLPSTKTKKKNISMHNSVPFTVIYVTSKRTYFPKRKMSFGPTLYPVYPW